LPTTMARRGDGRAQYTPAPRHADEVDDPDDECYGLGIMCCEPVGEGPAPDWRFVGQGRGGYDKVQAYSFVGHGAGSFQKEEVVAYHPTCRPRSECIGLLLLAALIVLVVWMAPSLWGASGSAVETATEKVLAPLLGQPAADADGIEGFFVVESLRYADVAASRALNRSLVAAVQRALAVEAGPPIQPSQVEAAPSRGPGAAVGVDFVVAAVPADHLRDVRARLLRAGPVESGIASELAAQTAVQAVATGPIRVHGLALSSDARGSTSASTTAALSFDCDSDFTECYECLRKSWSPRKLSWCCEHHGRGCGTTTTSVVYDCSEGYETWRLGWSSIKKEFCCRTRGQGCEAHDDASERGDASWADDTAASPGGVSSSSSSSSSSRASNTSRNESANTAAVGGSRGPSSGISSSAKGASGSGGSRTAVAAEGRESNVHDASGLVNRTLYSAAGIAPVPYGEAGLDSRSAQKAYDSGGAFPSAEAWAATASVASPGPSWAAPGTA